MCGRVWQLIDPPKRCTNENAPFSASCSPNALPHPRYQPGSTRIAIRITAPSTSDLLARSSLCPWGADTHCRTGASATSLSPARRNSARREGRRTATGGRKGWERSAKWCRVNDMRARDPAQEAHSLAHAVVDHLSPSGRVRNTSDHCGRNGEAMWVFNRGMGEARKAMWVLLPILIFNVFGGCAQHVYRRGDPLPECGPNEYVVIDRETGRLYCRLCERSRTGPREHDGCPPGERNWSGQGCSRNYPVEH